MSTLGDTIASLAARVPAVASYAAGGLRGRRMYVAVGVLFGAASIVVNVAINGVPQPLDAVFMLLALVLVALIPLRPVVGLVAYQLCWVVLFLVPGSHATDMLIANGAFFLFLGLLGVSRTALKAVFQAACLTARCSSSTSLGVLYPRAEWSRF